MSLIVAFIITLVSALVWLRMIDYLALKGIISSQLSRKIIHIGTGPIFVLCWLIFPAVPMARYVAAVVPLLISVQFFLIGIGVIKDQATVEGMSRSGDAKEILKGPLIYGIMFVLLTVLFWKDHPAGILGLMALCGGDGLADIVGRRIKSRPIPWSKSKTIGGTLAMFVGSFVLTVFIFFVFSQAGIFKISLADALLRIGLLSLLAAFVETIPMKDFDNLSVPIAVVIAGLWLFK
jgi:phytol kinase